MPEQQRRALLLREWQGLSYKEIAGELDLSQAAVETLLFRARRTLANELADAPPNKSSAGGRLRRSGDAGTMVAIAKSILFTGGTKVAATVATVAATSVVAATPATRHVVTDVVTPGHDRQAPVAHVAAKPKAKHVAAAAAPVACVRGRPSHRRARRRREEEDFREACGPPPRARARSQDAARLHAGPPLARRRRARRRRAGRERARSGDADEPADAYAAAGRRRGSEAHLADTAIVPSQPSKKHDSGNGRRRLEESRPRQEGRSRQGTPAPAVPSQPSTPTTANTPPFVAGDRGRRRRPLGKHDGDRQNGGRRDDNPSTSIANSTQHHETRAPRRRRPHRRRPRQIQRAI